ncbi:glycerophosphodiester phosphodiesterase domain-containing protein 5 isoform X2 [Danio rerio]|uniref:Glycerophosphodiester phosphodiesterase domain-containing protein 5 isoform X1 n=6 Tax=Danio rerio TaxID=7955 RepID=A0A8M2B872_DANRE|nr:glycerophosphodiester phosphodiesterase domain-containing protein 5 [Danio rerio]XP_021330126.1 glycerophosphodiester phosphodiesterase domain-containing protein 5 [Danio rerio]|eukprot:XP_005161302.1 glycerophosphodiester phosphodiesterase domain-containing protein 5 [Danio rerio]
MGSTPTSVTQPKLGKLKVGRQMLLQRYQHQPLVCCLAGLYGCQWRRYQQTLTQPGHCCRSKWECGSFALIVLTFCLSLVFLYFWSEAQNDYNDFDWFNFGNLGFWFPWSLVLLILAVFLFTYVAVLLLLAVCLLSEGQRLYLHWCHKIGILVTLILSIVASSVLSDLWGREWMTVLLSFQVTAPYLHIGGVVLITLLSWPIAFHVFRLNMKVSRIAIMLPYMTAIVSLYLAPLGLKSPCIKDSRNLGSAPALIGHRGAPMLAPENTYMSFEMALAAGADGLETDVTISYDGVPFLMHDKNLLRTTDVEDVFPNWTHVSPAMFTWRELQSLNAGSWFFSQDPFRTASSLSSGQRLQAQNQSVCTLRSFLDLAAQHGKLVVFDLYRPPRGHPYRDTWITQTLDVIHNQSSIHSSQVLWLPPELRDFVQELDPELQQITHEQAPVEELQLRRIARLNIHYSSMSETEIRKYAAANISTNLYVVSEPWLYSLAWCSGAHSVATNAVHILKKLQRPLFLMTPDEYRLMWTLTDITSLILIMMIFMFHWWRERVLAISVNNSSELDNGSYRQFRAELNDVWFLSNMNGSEKHELSL